MTAEAIQRPQWRMGIALIASGRVEDPPKPRALSFGSVSTCLGSAGSTVVGDYAPGEVPELTLAESTGRRP